MRIRTFIAESMEAAIAEIRDTMGPDAIIISTYESPRGRGVEVRAAVEDAKLPNKDIKDPVFPFDDDLERRLRAELLGEMKSEMTGRTDKKLEPYQPQSFDEEPKEKPLDYEVRPDGWVKTGIAGLLKTPLGRKAKGTASKSDETSPDPARPSLLEEQCWKDEELDAPLTFHNVPDPLKTSLIRAASAMDAESAVLALGAALDARLVMDPVPAIPARPIMLVGAPGAGKTVTIAKLAASAVLAGSDICLVTTDTLRAGALAQLEAFADILKTRVHTANSPEELKDVLAENEGKAIFIDSPATNAYIRGEMNDLLKFVRAGDIEPVLVAPATGDVHDFADVAGIFASIGVRRMITTRVDAARRLGGLIVAADQAGIALAQISITPYVAQGLSSINPLSLARLLVEVPSARAKVSPKLRSSGPGQPEEAAR